MSCCRPSRCVRAPSTSSFIKSASDVRSCSMTSASARGVLRDDHSGLRVIAIASEGSRAALVRFRVRFGRVIGRSVHLVDRSMDEDDEEILENVMTDLYFDAESVPSVVVVQSEELATPLVTEYLASVRGRPVDVTFAQRGKRRRVVEMAASDAHAVIE